jgi:hypothetical protein
MQDVVLIEAGRREHHYWIDLWRYREPLRVLAWRDLSVSVQANGDRCALGPYSAPSHHVGFHHKSVHYLRQARRRGRSRAMRCELGRTSVIEH